MANQGKNNWNQDQDDQGSGSMTVEEAGRKGGEKTRDNHQGTSFYEDIGRKGGLSKGQTAKEDEDDFGSGSTAQNMGEDES